MEDEFLTPKDAAAKLGCCKASLSAWANKGKIKYISTIGGHRRYNVTEFCKEKAQGAVLQTTNNIQKIKEARDRKFESGGAIYCRVSSHKQKNDLQRQVSDLKSKYPNYQIYTDICSGLKYKRKGLTRLLGHVQEGLIKHVVVAHKDRLARFGTELIKWIIDQAGASIKFENDDTKSSEQELTEDLMAIVHVFSCRANGKRRYQSNDKKRKKEEIDSLQEQNKRRKEHSQIEI